MAKCNECGANIPDNTKFCPQCGAAVIAAAAGAAAGAAQQGAYQKQNYQPGAYQQQQSYQQQNSQQAYQQNYQQQQAYQQQSYQQQYEKPKPVAPSPDAEQLRLLVALSYVLFPCMFVALLIDSDSNYVRRHCNQLIALYLWFMLCSLCCIVPVLGWVVGGIGCIAGVVFLLICFFRALKYDIFEIPITGKLNIVPQKD